MEIADTKAETLAHPEPARGRVHPDRGRSEGVVGREGQRAPVLPAVVGGAGRAGQDVVPFEDVGFGGVRGDVVDGGLGEVSVFASEAFVGGTGGHDLF